MTHDLPILYSFRRCPYAMRARLGLQYARIKYELREVVLRDKPPEMIAISPKATVPVLQVPNKSGKSLVIDESYAILKWAISKNDPENWQKLIPQCDDLVRTNDDAFKAALDKYKYASRFPEQTQGFYREQGEFFLNQLDQMLQQTPFLLGQKLTLADLAILPFIRQFAHVDKAWFSAAPYPHLSRWLNNHLGSALFNNIMHKYAPWKPEDHAVYGSDSHE